MLKRLLKNREGTAEIVGTVLFLVILFFFFSNVFLWHDQVSREIDQVIADKTNSTVRLELIAGARGLCSGETINYGDSYSGRYEYTWQVDGRYRVIREKRDPDGYYKLNVSYSFRTGIDTSGKFRSVETVSLNVYASYTDTIGEVCDIFVRDWIEEVWIDTQQSVQQQGWYTVLLSEENIYYGDGGLVSIMFVDSMQGSEDVVVGTLYVDYMDVRAEPVELELTNLGGLDVALSRLWIISSDAHVFVDLESLNVWVGGGAQIRIVLGSETRMNGGSVEVNYAPPAGEIVTFRILTEYGNTAACTYGFASD